MIRCNFLTFYPDTHAHTNKTHRAKLQNENGNLCWPDIRIMLMFNRLTHNNQTITTFSSTIENSNRFYYKTMHVGVDVAQKCVREWCVCVFLCCFVYFG